MIRLTKAQWDKIFFQKCNTEGFKDHYPEKAYTLEEYSKGLMMCSHRGSDKYISLALVGAFNPEYQGIAGTRWIELLKDIKRERGT